jgi:hypothetical protein
LAPREGGDAVHSILIESLPDVDVNANIVEAIIEMN